MAPHIVLVYRGGPSGAAKRQQAGGTGAARRKARAKAEKESRAATAAALAAAAELGEVKSSKKVKKSKRHAAAAAATRLSNPQPNQTGYHQEQQQQQGPVAGVGQPYAVCSGPLLRKPLPLRKPVPGRKSQAVVSPPSPPSLQSSPSSCQDDFSSSASTLVASSDASSPCLKLKGSSSPNIAQGAAAKRTAPSPQILGPPPPYEVDNGANAALLVQPHRHAAEPGTTHPILRKLSSVLASIDGETYGGSEEELVLWQQEEQATSPRPRGGFFHSNRIADPLTNDTAAIPKHPAKKTSYFAKANLYANARLPPNLPAFNIHLHLFPLICLAAQYSKSVYRRPSGLERETHVEADRRMGTKAMVMKSVPVDNMNVIIFAIRGTHTFMDWAVNLQSAPTSPEHFLGDPGNLCHSGFLSVARRMIRPVAARLRALLEENPGRSSCSLVLTGHSAGGAVASLLFTHMVSRGVNSELIALARYFKRIHCFTFGAPPVSLLPLRKPDLSNFQANSFLSFVNEGDPVPRADREYVRSLIDLFASPAPESPSAAASPASSRFKFFKPKRRKMDNLPYLPVHVWQPPPGTLSNAGQLVVLRRTSSGSEDDIRACITNDQQLRTVMFGDPVMHMMKVYAERLEVLATKAVTGRV